MQECVYASQAAGGEIDGISVKTLRIGGHAVGSKNDTGASNGIGLAMNSQVSVCQLHRLEQYRNVSGAAGLQN